METQSEERVTIVKNEPKYVFETPCFLYAFDKEEEEGSGWKRRAYGVLTIYVYPDIESHNLVVRRYGANQIGMNCLISPKSKIEMSLVNKRICYLTNPEEKGEYNSGNGYKLGNRFALLTATEKITEVLKDAIMVAIKSYNEK